MNYYTRYMVELLCELRNLNANHDIQLSQTIPENGIVPGAEFKERLNQLENAKAHREWSALLHRFREDWEAFDLTPRPIGVTDVEYAVLSEFPRSWDMCYAIQKLYPRHCVRQGAPIFTRGWPRLDISDWRISLPLDAAVSRVRAHVCYPL